ncbi:MgtC/SapB family protein [Patescibacteria group bacterium]|nr:MgtC/SapB family protein [Patescibacteria group bacterium]
MTEFDLLLRLFLALVFGGIIGWEREKGHKPAGLRTHMLVGMGSCLFTMVSFLALTGLQNFYLDPTRIAAGIVTGIGFLGAGAILQSKGEVHGLTTAASIWMVAAIGMAVGYGLFILAAGAAILSLLVLYLLEKLEEKSSNVKS